MGTKKLHDYPHAGYSDVAGMPLSLALSFYVFSVGMMLDFVVKAYMICNVNGKEVLFK